jgi:hypothetical protein
MIGIKFLTGREIFLFATMSMLYLRLSHHPLRDIMNILLLEVKQSKYETDQSPPYSVELKIVGRELYFTYISMARYFINCGHGSASFIFYNSL